MAAIYPSLMGADLLDLRDVIKKLEHEADGFHVDIMDYHFVRNITWGVDTVNAIAQEVTKPLWVHLMVENPIDWNEDLFLPAGTLVSFHLEAEKEIPRLIKEIKEKNCRAGIAIKPETNIEDVFPLFESLDNVLLMGVNPGFSGQPFLPEVAQKIEMLVAYRDTSRIPFKIGLDGGVNKTNIKELTNAGVDVFAIASGIFYADDPLEALKELKKLAA